MPPNGRDLESPPHPPSASAPPQEPAPQPRHPTPTSHNPSTIQALITETQLFLGAMDKVIRMHALYEGKGDNYDSTRHHTYSLLQKLLERQGTIKLYIEPHRLLLEEQPVWENDSDKDGPSYRMFKDGLRIITLQPGLTTDEFGLLVQVMQGKQPGQAEHNAVTLLWEAEPPHIQYRAIKVFHEGTEDSDLGGSQEDIGPILGVLRQPLHTPGASYTAPNVSGDILAKTREVRQKIIAHMVDGGDHLSYLKGLRKQVGRASEELWPRAIHIASHMIQLGLDRSQVSAILSQVLQEMLAGGKWADLGRTCRVMAATAAGGQEGDQDSALQGILNGLAEDKRLLAIEDRLLRASPESFAQLAEFLKILPDSANDDLRELLLKLPQGDIATRLRQLLEERGVDVTDHYAQNLSSNNVEQVKSAIRILSEMGTSRALKALPRVLSHPSARIRMEALHAIKGRIKPGDLSNDELERIIPSLGASYPALHQAVFDVLEDLPRCNCGEALLELLQQPDAAEKLDSIRRRRIYILMVRWGGAKVDDFIIDGVCASGLFLRRKQQELRDDLLDALEMVGGDRSRNLIAACRSRQPSKAVRESLDALAKRL
jgi:hypothetical protein